MPVVESERTLGFDLGPGVTTSSVVASRGQTMSSRMHQYKIIWQSDLPVKKKVEKYKALVLSKAIWGLHLLPLTEANLAHLEYMHCRSLRRILKLKAAYYRRRGPISNAEVRKRAKSSTVMQMVRRKQLALLGHVLRRPFHDPDRLACFEPDASCTPRRPENCHVRVGAPRKTWFKSLLPLFTQNGIPQATLHSRAQDRSGWYELSERLCA